MYDVDKGHSTEQYYKWNLIEETWNTHFIHQPHYIIRVVYSASRRLHNLFMCVCLAKTCLFPMCKAILIGYHLQRVSDASTLWSSVSLVINTSCSINYKLIIKLTTSEHANRRRWIFYSQADLISNIYFISLKPDLITDEDNIARQVQLAGQAPSVYYSGWRSVGQVDCDSRERTHSWRCNQLEK